MRRSLWPRCGFVYYSYDTPTDIRKRKCVRAWGHWLRYNSPHMGPLVSGRDAWIRDGNDIQFGTEIHGRIEQYYRDMNEPPQ